MFVAIMFDLFIFISFFIYVYNMYKEYTYIYICLL